MSDGEDGPALLAAGISPEEMAEAFARYARRTGLLSRADEEQCAEIAKAFGAGYVYGAATGGRVTR